MCGFQLGISCWRPYRVHYCLFLFCYCCCCFLFLFILFSLQTNDFQPSFCPIGTVARVLLNNRCLCTWLFRAWKWNTRICISLFLLQFIYETHTSMINITIFTIHINEITFTTLLHWLLLIYLKSLSFLKYMHRLFEHQYYQL